MLYLLCLQAIIAIFVGNNLFIAAIIIRRVYPHRMGQNPSKRKKNEDNDKKSEDEELAKKRNIRVCAISPDCVKIYVQHFKY